MRARNRLRILCFFLSREVRYVNPFRFYTISPVDATRRTSAARRALTYALPRAYISHAHAETILRTLFIGVHAPIRVVSFALFCLDVWLKSRLMFGRGGTGADGAARIFVQIHAKSISTGHRHTAPMGTALRPIIRTKLSVTFGCNRIISARSVIALGALLS